MEKSRVYVGALGTSDRRPVLESVSWAAFAPQGYLLFQREATLFALRFDPDRLQVSGEPERLSTVYMPVPGASDGLGGEDTGVRERPTAATPVDVVSGGRSRPDRGCARDHLFDLSPDGTRVVAQVDYPSSLWLIRTSRALMRLTRARPTSIPVQRRWTAVLFDRGPQDKGRPRHINVDGGQRQACSVTTEDGGETHR
jgi:hypothetical protein